jgi:signal peptidase I
MVRLCSEVIMVIETDAPAAPDSPLDQPKRARPGRLFLEILAMLFVALLASFLIKSFVVQSFYVPSPSMENTLLVNDRVLVPVWSGSSSHLKRGDVIVFRDPGGWLPETPTSTLSNPLTGIASFIGLLPPDGDNHLVKRIIGLPGDTVSCCSATGSLVVDGTPIDEPYVVRSPTSPDADGFQYTVTVPPGMLWVLGDNRFNSADSAFHFSRNDGDDFVPESDVVGIAGVINWPVNRWRAIDSYPEVFAPIGHSTPAKAPQG